MLKKHRSSIILALATLGLLLPFYFWLSRIYWPRVSAFSCFDDCFNYLGGYFLLKGKALYSQIFFNHQPLMAFLSALVQRLAQPGSVYELLLRHRQFVFWFGLGANLLLVWRFKWLVLVWVIIFETSKFYLFGDRFLAEGLVVYLLVYLFGLAWLKLSGSKPARFEVFFSVILAWLVVFLRLPYTPVVLGLLLVIFWGKNWLRTHLGPSLLLIGLMAVTILSLSPLDYFFNLITVNQLTGRLAGFQLIQSLAYPVWVIFTRPENIFPQWLWFLNLIFLGLLTWLAFQKHWRLVLIIAFSLTLSNLIIIPPGQVFFEAFHVLPWYGLLLAAVFLMVGQLIKTHQKAGLLTLGLMGSAFMTFVFSPGFFAWEKVNAHEELVTNFGHQIQVGRVVKNLADSNDSLFLDGFDDLIYWQADRESNYPYSWYTSVMPKVPRYAQARLEMFDHQPPDFYYGSCPGVKVSAWSMPQKFRADYTQLTVDSQPSCLYVHQEKINKITHDQWQRVKQIHYERP